MVDNRKNNNMLWQNALRTITSTEDSESSFNVEVHERPLITFALVAYNQERFIRDAVSGAFSQTYSPLEIILSDDCSTDNTFGIMKELANSYTGPHRVILNRNPHNLGIGAHVNRIMELSKGELIVGAAGDDVSVPERVQEIYKAYLASDGLAMSIHSAVILVDEEDKELGVTQDYPVGYKISLDEAVKNGTKVWGCAHVWHRKVFERFGPLSEDVALEDEAISLRSLLIGRIVHVKRALVLYRIHGGNVHGEINMLRKGTRRFSSPAQLYRWRLKKLTGELPVYKQFSMDLQKGVDGLDQEEREKIERKVRQRIGVLETELNLRLAGTNENLVGVVLRAGWNPLRVAKLALLVLYPALFARLSFFKWQFGCVCMELVKSCGAMMR